MHRSFSNYAATVVEVAVDEKGRLSVPRADTAIDCGLAANPKRIRRCRSATGWPRDGGSRAQPRFGAAAVSVPDA